MKAQHRVQQQLCFNNLRLLALIQTTWNRERPLFTVPTDCIHVLFFFFLEKKRKKNKEPKDENRRGQICLSVRRATDAQDEKWIRLPRNDRQQQRQQQSRKRSEALLLAEPPVFPFETDPLLFSHCLLSCCYRGKQFCVCLFMLLSLFHKWLYQFNNVLIGSLSFPVGKYRF